MQIVNKILMFYPVVLRSINEHPEHTLSIVIFFSVLTVMSGLIAGLGVRNSIEIFTYGLNALFKFLSLSISLTYGLAVILYFVGVVLIVVTMNAALISLLFGLPVFIFLGFVS